MYNLSMNLGKFIFCNLESTSSQYNILLRKASLSQLIETLSADLNSVFRGPGWQWVEPHLLKPFEALNVG